MSNVKTLSTPARAGLRGVDDLGDDHDELRVGLVARLHQDLILADLRGDDLQHAVEHLGDLLRLVLPERESRPRALRARISGPMPSSELKVRAAARVAMRDSLNTVIVIETTRSTA